MYTLAEANDGCYVVLQTHIMISLISFYTYLASAPWRSDGAPSSLSLTLSPRL